jgi:hypothetical protein
MTNELINRFSKVLERIAPHNSEVDALKTHKNTIEAALAREFEHYNRVEVIGSHTRDRSREFLMDTASTSQVVLDLHSGLVRPQSRQ